MALLPSAFPQRGIIEQLLHGKKTRVCVWDETRTHTTKSEASSAAVHHSLGLAEPAYLDRSAGQSRHPYPVYIVRGGQVNEFCG